MDGAERRASTSDSVSLCLLFIRGCLKGAVELIGSNMATFLDGDYLSSAGFLAQMAGELFASREFTTLLEQVELSGAVAMSFVRGCIGAELLNILFLQ